MQKCVNLQLCKNLIIVKTTFLLSFLFLPFESVVQIWFKHVSSSWIFFIKFDIVLYSFNIAIADNELTPGIWHNIISPILSTVIFSLITDEVDEEDDDEEEDDEDDDEEEDEEEEDEDDEDESLLFTFDLFFFFFLDAVATDICKLMS